MNENSSPSAVGYFLVLMAIVGIFAVLLTLGGSLFLPSLENLTGQDLNKAARNLTAEEIWRLEVKENPNFLTELFFFDSEMGEEINGGLKNNSHASEKHLTDADTVRSCFKNNNVLEGIIVLFNPDTGRVARICYILDSGKFGIQIIEKVGNEWQEVTSFVKNKMKNLTDVIRYLNNTGYVKW